MIHLVDDGLERLLRAAVPLTAEVDVSFATPDRRWGASLNRPTVNLFLATVATDPERSSLGFEQRRVDDRLERRPAAPKVALDYVLTAWATEHRDEHQLLGAVLRAILANPLIDRAHLGPELAAMPAMQLSIAGKGDPAEAGHSLDGQLKPTLGLTVHLSVDALPWITAAEPPDSVTVATHQRDATTDTEESSGAPTVRRRRRGSSVMAEIDRTQGS